MRRVLVVLVAVLLLAVSTAGCLEPYRAVVPATILDASPRDWVVTQKPLESFGAFGPNLVETEYRFDPPSSGAPYPGLLLVIGLRAAVRGDSDDLLERTREVLQDVLREEGVTVDAGQELRGQRLLDSGARTKWFRMVGESTSDGLFTQSEEVRVLGETWFDGRSNTNVIVVAMAQTTGPSALLFQPPVRNHAVWDELVGDPSGSIGGSFSENGFIFHIRSHG